MKNNMKFVHGMAGLLSVSALTIGFANSANAAIHIASDVGHGITSYVSSDGGTGVFAPGSAVNITYSRHNLGTTNKLGSNHTLGSSGGGPNGTSVLDSGGNVVGTNQICVFCHTPHGFNAAQSGPLWNKAVNTSTTYSVYNSGSNKSSTFDADTPSIGSVSLACLSCHDGTQAMDNMINGPGSGLMAANYDGTNSAAVASKFYISDGAGESQAYTWGDTAGGFAQMSQGGAQMTGSFVNSDTPALEGILLGTDLSNDHPISMQYCGGGITSNLNSGVTGTAVEIARGTCRDRLFTLPTVAAIDASGGMRFWVDTNIIPDSDAIAAGSASTGGVTANPITRDPDTVEIYVTDGTTTANSTAAISQNLGNGEGGSNAVTVCGSGNNGDACGRGFVASTATNFTPIPGAGIRTKQDIMLFTNNGAATANDGGPTVECASCHDPHTPNNGTFLRVSNQGSGLCLSCHVK